MDKGGASAAAAADDSGTDDEASRYPDTFGRIEMHLWQEAAKSLKKSAVKRDLDPTVVGRHFAQGLAELLESDEPSIEQARQLKKKALRYARDVKEGSGPKRSRKQGPSEPVHPSTLDFAPEPYPDAPKTDPPRVWRKASDNLYLVSRHSAIPEVLIDCEFEEHEVAVWQEAVGLVHNLARVLHAARSRHMNHYEVTCQEQVAALWGVFAAQPHERKDRVEALDSVAAFLIRAGCHVQAPGQTPVAIEALRRRASNHGSDVELVTSLLGQTDLCREAALCDMIRSAPNLMQVYGHMLPRE